MPSLAVGADVLEGAFRYPTRGDDAVATLLVGGGLGLAALAVGVLGLLFAFVAVGFVILPFALIPSLFVRGYCVDVVRHRLDGDPDPPRFEDWWSLFVDGVKASVVALVYAVPALVIVGALAASAFGARSAGAAVGGAVVLLVLVLALVLYSLAAAYCYPAGVANWVREDDFGAAFSVSALGEASVDSRYLVPWLAALFVGIVGGLVGQALLAVVVGVVVLFYVRVVVWYCWAEGYAEATDLDRSGGGGGPAAVGGAGDGDAGGGTGYGNIRYGPPTERDEWPDLPDAVERVGGDEHE